jgi:hypothetical protein
MAKHHKQVIIALLKESFELAENNFSSPNAMNLRSR